MIDVDSLEIGKRVWDGDVGARKARSGKVTWYIRYLIGAGRRKVETVRHAKNKKQAQSALDVRKGEVFQRTWQPNAKQITVREYAPQFLIDKAKLATVKKYKSQLDKHLLPYFGAKTLTEITVADCKRYMSKRDNTGASPATVRNELRCLQSLLRSAIEDGKQATDPVEFVRFEVSNKRERVLTEPERKLLFTAIHDRQDRMTPLVMILVFTGLRIAHACRLRWDEIDLKARVMRTTPDKKGKPIVVPLVPALVDTLQWWQQRCGSKTWVFPSTWKKLQHTTKNAIDKEWRKVLFDAGISGLWKHDLRRTFTSELRNRGIAGEAARALIGHSSVEMTERYHVPQVEALREAVLALPGARDPSVIQNRQDGSDFGDQSGASAAGKTNAK